MKVHGFEQQFETIPVYNDCRIYEEPLARERAHKLSRYRLVNAPNCEDHSHSHC